MTDSRTGPQLLAALQEAHKAYTRIPEPIARAVLLPEQRFKHDVDARRLDLEIDELEQAYRDAVWTEALSK